MGAEPYHSRFVTHSKLVVWVVSLSLKLSCQGEAACWISRVALGVSARTTFQGIGVWLVGALRAPQVAEGFLLFVELKHPSWGMSYSFELGLVVLVVVAAVNRGWLQMVRRL
jgi:hypothetical protein